MKSFIFLHLFLVTFGIFFSLASTIYAQEENTPTTTATSTIEATSTISETPVVAPPVVEKDRSVILERRAQERIINLAANISNRFDAIIGRLENITKRLNTRIKKLEDMGYDTNNAKSSLHTARNALAAAKTEMETIDQAVIYAVGSQSPKTEWQKVRAKYFSARENIKIAHSALRTTIGYLKNVSVAAPPPVATTTDPIL